MPSENLNMDEVTDERRKALAATIRTISIKELNTLGEELFPFYEHPWRETYFNFIRENSGCTFHHAVTNDRVHIIYCGEKNRGIWFLPESGKGPLQEKGLEVMKQLAAGVR